MALPIGKMEYEIGTPLVTGNGLSYSDEELNTALMGPVAAIVFDDEGIADLTTILQNVIDTDFDRSELERILNNETTPKNWEVGEAMAEAYLIHHNDCHFPWPDGRDIRKPKSSLPVADMVGFHMNNKIYRFTFGEVKTSQENKYPPQVVKYGEHALNEQIRILRDKKNIRDTLVFYLGHRAGGSDWEDKFQSAAKNYIRSSGSAVSIFGVIVRDVIPDRADFEETYQFLSNNCPIETIIKLLAIYIPSGSIDTLGEKIMSSRKGGET